MVATPLVVLVMSGSKAPALMAWMHLSRMSRPYDAAVLRPPLRAWCPSIRHVLALQFAFQSHDSVVALRPWLVRPSAPGSKVLRIPFNQAVISAASMAHE